MDFLIHVTFSLLSWTAERGVLNVSDMTPVLTNELTQTLGVDDFLAYPEKCSLSSSPYKCTNVSSSNLPNITDIDNVACHLYPSCTGVACCVYVDWLRHSFHSYIEFDTCLYILTVGIEDLKQSMDLLTYAWEYAFC
ncbi:hypothetical protein KUTeg_002085 [Tegillarca granosa]|uniref:Uncharacterized protein n=1 Tax=Tegillarca granosa TaxID=220873 RepID=A0ABQ9FTB8_TEGGR|nr:hypothetical protein KUTeg_002085 [Tegillarca granosa]